MNILLIDRALPSSIYSGKTTRLKNIYGRLAQENQIIYLRTSQVGESKESEELNLWAKRTFHQCLRMPPLPRTSLISKVRTVAAMRPWYDLHTKNPRQLKTLFHNLYRICAFYDIHVVVTFDLEVAQYGELLSQTYPWIQDLGDSMVLQIRRMQKKVESQMKHMSLFIRECREKKFEEEMARKAAATIFVAHDDAHLYDAETDIQLEVIPNGIDYDFFDPDLVMPIRDDYPYVVFTGHMSFIPNQDAVIFFAKKILPLIRKNLPRLKFKIVGADPSEAVYELEKISGVEVTGAVEDLRPYLAGASAFVCPMRMGSGIKNKLLEAMSMKVPIVGSPLAAAGISHLPADLMVTSHEPADFANEVCDLIFDADRRASIGELSRAFIKRHYSWERTVNRYRDLFHHTAGRKVQA
jgi:glycosyltransferase involved in cell wall biosynthesis